MAHVARRLRTPPDAPSIAERSRQRRDVICGAGMPPKASWAAAGTSWGRRRAHSCLPGELIPQAVRAAGRSCSRYAKYVRAGRLLLAPQPVQAPLPLLFTWPQPRSAAPQIVQVTGSSPYREAAGSAPWSPCPAVMHGVPAVDAACEYTWA